MHRQPQMDDVRNPAPSPADAYQLRVLDIVRQGARVVVGGLIVEVGRRDIGELDVDFVRGLSGVLFDRGVTIGLTTDSR